MLVEAKRDTPWTKPEDIPYDPDKPMPALGGCLEGGFHIALADISVHFVPSTISEKLLRALITKAGGEMAQSRMRRRRSIREPDGRRSFSPA